MIYPNHWFALNVIFFKLPACHRLRNRYYKGQMYIVCMLNKNLYPYSLDNSVNTKQSNSDSTPIPDQQPQDNKPAEAQKIRRRKRVLKSKMHLNDEGYMGKFLIYKRCRLSVFLKILSKQNFT